MHNRRSEASESVHTHPHRHADGTVHVHEHDHDDHEHFPRTKRTEPVGQTRSTRLPISLDQWFEERIARHHTRSSSELLVELIQGGLRLREGYMPIHRRTLERLLLRADTDAFSSYMRCLFDTFGHEYVRHLESWLRSDGFVVQDTLHADE